MPFLSKVKIRNSNLLEKEYLHYQKMIWSGLTTESALVTMRISEISPTGAEDYSCFEKLWEEEKKPSFKDFLRWYKNKDVILTIEAGQKKIEVYHNKGNKGLDVFFKLYLRSSTSAKFYPFTQSDRDLLSKSQEDMVEGMWKMFTREAVVSKTNIRSSTNVRKMVVGIDAGRKNLVQFVNLCLQDCTQDSSLMQIC